LFQYVKIVIEAAAAAGVPVDNDEVMAGWLGGVAIGIALAEDFPAEAATWRQNYKEPLSESLAAQYTSLVFDLAARIRTDLMIGEHK